MAEIPKVEGNSNPQKDALECRMKRVEIIGRVQQIKSEKVIDDLNIQRMRLENKQLEKQGSGWGSPLDQLLSAAQVMVIDNEKTLVGSEPAIRSLWNEDEIEEIKYLMMAKIRKL